MCNVTRQRKPLKPVTGTCRWLLPEVNGHRRLSINGTPYELEDLDGRGYRLYRFQADGTSTAYDIDTNTSWGDWQCDCPSATFRPEQPCKHTLALRKLLALPVE